MNLGKTLACIQAGFCALTAIGYVVSGDIRMAMYWLFAAGITVTVTL